MYTPRICSRLLFVRAKQENTSLKLRILPTLILRTSYVNLEQGTLAYRVELTSISFKGGGGLYRFLLLYSISYNYMIWLHNNWYNNYLYDITDGAENQIKIKEISISLLVRVYPQIFYILLSHPFFDFFSIFFSIWNLLEASKTATNVSESHVIAMNSLYTCVTEQRSKFFGASFGSSVCFAPSGLRIKNLQ